MSLKLSSFRSDSQITDTANSPRVKAARSLRLHILQWGVTAMCLVPITLMQGCMEMNLGSSLAMPSLDKLAFKTSSTGENEDVLSEEFNLEVPEEIDPPFIGDYITASGLNLIILEGVGLVTGLDGTGGDPPPSKYRTMLLKDMQRRDIPSPNKIIRSPSTALVVVRGYLPPLVQPGDHFDVEIRVPAGSEVTSLNGGWLLQCRLTERAIIAGQGVKSGKERARAHGPILVSTGEGKSNSLLKRGDIVGGAVAYESRDMRLYLSTDMRSVRNATRIAGKIGERFFNYDRYGHREPLSKPMNDHKIILKIHPAYKDNFHRYVQVIKNIAFRETSVEQQVRMERLGETLLIPEKAELAAVQLEAIGLDAIPLLKKGLEADTLESRFHAGVALAYLGETDGLQVLYEAARDEPAFRVFAMAAMSAIHDGETHILFRQLMDEEMMEVRYGAFRGLTTIESQDPLVLGETLNDQCKLHVLDVPGKPMIHLTHQQKAEIVLFGRQQKFNLPISVSAGPHIMVNSAPGSNQVVVSRYRLGEKDQRVVVSSEIAEVIRAAAQLGASYPDLAQMLVQAERQQNLPGQIGIDMLPTAGRYYVRPGNGENSTRPSRKKIGRSNMAPNQFSKLDPNDKDATKPLLIQENLQDEAEQTDEPGSGSLHTPEVESKSASTTSNSSDEETKTRIQAEEVKIPFYKKYNPIRKTQQLLTPKPNGELVFPDAPPEQ